MLPRLRADATGDDLAHFVGHLSAASTVALLAVLFTGIYNADRGLGGSLVPLSHSEWGLILDAKPGLVSAAVVLGGVNRLALSTDRFRASPLTDRSWPALGQ